VDLLRDILGLKAPKWDVGKNVGCAVSLLARQSTLVSFQLQGWGKSVVTVRFGQEDGQLHQFSRPSFLRVLFNAVSVPGMIMSLNSVGPSNNEEKIRQRISRVLCRCTLSKVSKQSKLQVKPE
jgi:aerobic-type carbon monoxide dehydrogenase small subunit (CoxS/CutS family)